MRFCLAVLVFQNSIFLVARAWSRRALDGKIVSHPTHTIVDMAFSIDVMGFDDDGM